MQNFVVRLNKKIDEVPKKKSKVITMGYVALILKQNSSSRLFDPRTKLFPFCNQIILHNTLSSISLNYGQFIQMYRINVWIILNGRNALSNKVKKILFIYLCDVLRKYNIHQV